MVDVSIVLPTYNEKEAIVANIAHIITVMDKAKKWKYEVIVVDDNSPDGTAEAVRVLAKKKPQVRVIVRTKDRGLGLSIGRGVKEAKGSIIVGMDADGNHDPRDLPVLLTELTRGTKLVVASRFVGEGGMKGWRMLPTLLFNGTFRLFGLPIWDNTSGYYAIRKSDLAKLGIDKIYYGYGDYHLRLVFAAAAKGYSMVEVPTNYQPRLGGASKSKLLKMAVEYLREAYRLRKEGWK